MSVSERQPIVRFGIFTFDPSAGELRKHDRKLKIQGQPLEILAMLVERPGEIVTREELQKRLWPEETFVDFEHSLNAAVKRLRDAMGDSADAPRYVETLARRGYRFIAEIERQGQSLELGNDRQAGFVPSHGSGASSTTGLIESPGAGLFGGLFGRSWKLVGGGTLFVAGLILAGLYVRSHQTHHLTGQDTIVLADFSNTTGDPVFDGALRQGLSVQLEQSPFLKLLSEDQIQHTLRMMKQPPDARLLPEIAREICQRTSSTIVLDGSIAQIGTQYSLILRAVNCSNGESLTSTEAQASDKNHVLEALEKSSSDIRRKLGESLSTVQKFATPIEEATTSSLEALKAYSLGRKANAASSDVAALPLFQWAIHLDPNFAMAYGALGTSYFNLGEFSLAAENTQKAYELRDRVSEPEKFYIESHYHNLITGDLEKARQIYELWEQTYPRDAVAPRDLGITYQCLGQYEKELAEVRKALRVEPGSGVNYDNLADDYVKLNRLEEARTTAEEAQAKKLDSPLLRFTLYQLAFVQNDAAGMAKQVVWSAAQPGVENVFLEAEADTAAYLGRLAKARDLSRQAVASAERAEEKETAAIYEADAALREALFGNAAEARQHVAAALRLSTGRDVQYGAALALALVRDIVQGRALADDLARRFPEDTIVQFNYLPTVHAQLALSRNDASNAIEVLQTATPYELGAPSASFNFASLYPAYMRGEAYLAAHQPAETAVEFQKILDHRGIVGNEPIGALARLGLARANALRGDTAKARASYRDFLTLWKDADPDVPILKEAKAEYAKLQY